MVTENKIGIMLRYTEICNCEAIVEHNKLLKAKGRVFFGKYGRGVGNNNVRSASSSKTPYNLIITKKGSRGREFKK